MEKKRILVSEEDQLSPVALVTRDANLLSLPPLQWHQYDSIPDKVFARNTGFTVTISASFKGEVPYLSSGPLSGQYNFSQIHFHWGEHDETGSGHSVNGVRRPLEMHVVHVKKDCANFNEAGEVNDGIAIVVHLFSLSEERNTRLDQLTAVLQFIQKSNCCARLYPSSLAEIVCPFSQDYFLYRGAVPGSSQQPYRIVWLVSRQEQSVSSQQLEQLRNLQDGKGHYIWSNSNTPHPLGDRPLYLVSTSIKSVENNQYVPQIPSKVLPTSVSKRSVESLNAEFKSLVALEDVEVGSCAICPHPNHDRKAKSNAASPVKINEGNTSVEESCVDLGRLHGSASKVKNEINYDKKYLDPEDNKQFTPHGVTSLQKSIVMNRDPSTEQACILLTKSVPSVHLTKSSPSLPTWGYLCKTKEYTDLSAKTNDSCEKIVFEKCLGSLEIEKRADSRKSVGFHEKTMVSTEISINVKEVKTKNTGDKLTPQDECEGVSILRHAGDNEGEMSEPELKGEKYIKGEVFNNGEPKYYLVKQETEQKDIYYKVIGELFMTPESKGTYLKHYVNTNEGFFTEKRDATKQVLSKQESLNLKNIVYKKDVVHFSSPSREIFEDEKEKNKYIEQNENVVHSKMRLKVTSNSEKVELENQNLSKKSKSSEETANMTAKKYYVTRITPITSNEETHKATAEQVLFYARPLQRREEESEDKFYQSHKSTSKEIIDKNNSTSNICNTDIDNSQHQSLYKSQKSIFNFKEQTVDPETSTEIFQSQKEIEAKIINKNPENLNNPSKNKTIKLSISFKGKNEKADSNNNKERIGESNLKMNNINAGCDLKNGNIENVQEEHEVRTIFTSEQTKKTLKIQVTTPTVKIPNQPPSTSNDQPNPLNLVTIQKVEIPDPFYLKKIPKQPVVEHKFTTNPQQHVTEETMTEETTVKTYRSTKKINKQATVGGDKTNCGSFLDNNKMVKVKNAKTMTDSDQPINPFNSKKITFHDTSNEENSESDKVRVLFQPNKTSLPDQQSQYTNMQINLTSSTRRKNHENCEDIGTNTPESNKVTDNNVGTISDKGSKFNRNFVDVATSNPFTPTIQHLPKQQPQEPIYSDLQQEPTKDPGFHIIEEGELNRSNQEQRLESTNMENKPPSESNTTNVKSNSKSDHIYKASIVYIQQPKPHLLSLSSKESSLDRQKTVSSKHLNSQDGNKTKMNQGTQSERMEEAPKEYSYGNLKRAVKEKIEEPADKSEELISTHDYVNDKEASVTSHCSVTFKSETKIKLPSLHVVELKSMTKVEIKPTSNLVSTKHASRNEVNEIITNQMIKPLTEDKCCSTLELRKINKSTASAGSLTSEEDEKEETINTKINFSPVLINTDTTELKALPPLQFIDHWNRNPNEDALLENNGKTVRATILVDQQLPQLRGGPLESDYVFAELHFHWGRKDCCGAEHIIDNQRLTMEAHFLYFKKEYGSVKEAVLHDDGIAIVAVQFKVGGPPHPLFDQLIKDISVIREPLTGVYVPSPSLFSWIKDIVYNSKGYYSYKGTMTLEPPFVETVTWIIFDQPITFCCQQSITFRNLKNKDGEPLLKTNRPAQPLNNRIIYYIPS